ncbi:MAG: alpha/beta hydrolase [Bdellovibrionales bacterium]|nr:alpha/beta hydrolase [Bdellovibrionales bacterium]
MKSFSQAITVFILFYIIFVGIMYVLQRKLLYYPWKARPSLGNLKGVYSEVQTQTEDQLTLTHWYAKRGRPYVVIFHGNAGNIEGRGYKFKFLVDQGYSVLLVSYRGYGGNLGQPTEKDLISDSSLALEWLLRKEGISSKEVILLGESLGSGVAVALAAKYPVKGLIFDGAYSSISDVGQSVYPLLPVRWLLKDTWNSKDRIQKVQSPILFIHSKRDKVIPFRFAARLFEAAHEPKKHIWLEQTDHNDNLQTETVRNSIVKFIQSLWK